MFLVRAFVVFALTITVGSSAFSRDLLGAQSTKSDSQQTTASSADTITPMVVDWPVKFAHLQTGTVWTSFDCFGNFGSNGTSLIVPPLRAFEYPSGSGVEYLFSGALWVGGIVGGDTLVSIGDDGWVGNREFDLAYGEGNHGSIDSIGYAVDYSLHSLFTDTTPGWSSGTPLPLTKKPLPIRVAIRAHLMQSPPANDFVIYDVVLTNIGVNPIEEGWAGIMMDCDVGDIRADSRFVDDVAGTLQNEGTVYIADNDGNLPGHSSEYAAPSAFAMKILATSSPSMLNFNWWIPNGNSNLDFGPRRRPTPGDPWREFAEGNLGTPVSEEDKYYMLKHHEWDYDQIRTATISPSDTMWMPPNGELAVNFADGFDTRFLLSAGPFDLAPGASSRIIFAMSAADTLHHVVGNLANLPYSPDVYLANLNFTGMLTNVHLADSLGTILLDPMLPALGLREVISGSDSILIEWDPWVFPEVVGYDLFVEEVPPGELPYPGVAPPWLTFSSPGIKIELGDTYHHTLHGLDSQKFFKIAVANRTASATGDPSRPVTVSTHQRASAPQFVNEFVFVHAGEPMTLNWSAPSKAGIDHFNIYKFADSAAASKRFHAFYDKGFAKSTVTPTDSFEVNGTSYWFYHTPSYVQVPGNQTSYTDPGFTSDAIYVVTSVDADGFESEFSVDITANTISVRDRQILLYTGFSRASNTYVPIDSIRNFYDSILGDLDYATYLYIDSINSASCTQPLGFKDRCIDWHDFMRYELVIFDDAFLNRILSPAVARSVCRRILLSGGKLAVFGSLGALTGLTVGMPPRALSVVDQTASRFFGIDSILEMGPLYPPSRPDPKSDTVHGFVLAEPTSADIPAVRIDSLRKPASSLVYQRFPSSSGPGVSTFVIDSNAVITHRYRSAFPATSANEGQIVGLRSNAEGCETWLFGFHLWYMRYGPARDLIHRILTGEPSRTVTATIEVEPAYGYHARQVGGRTGTLLIGNITDGHSVNDVNPSTLRIFGTLPVAGSAIEAEHIGFVGELLSATFQFDSLVKLMEPLSLKKDREIAIEGSYNDNTPFQTIAYLQTVARYTGDVDGNYLINISDVTAMVSWFFLNGPQPSPKELMDANGNCRVNIVDLTYVITYLFRGGAATRYCEP
ncbi:MAG: dockerin type I domain-containing protein [Candidatus Zixiibacteriota bacterium]